MFEKLEEIKHRFEEVGQLIVQPDVMSDMQKYVKLGKEYKDLEKIISKYDTYNKIKAEINSAKEMQATEKDKEFKELAKMELEELTPKLEKIEEELKQMLIPKDSNDSKNIILEIRAGTGGDEAAIFAGGHVVVYAKTLHTYIFL